MTNVLEGIRFLDVEEGIVIPDDEIRVQVETRDLHHGEPVQNGEDWLEEIIPLTPLLKFPDKDSEGNDCWSGDLFIEEKFDKIFFLRFRRYEWELSFHGGSSLMHCAYLNEGLKRLCSIYDSNVTEYLDQDTIDKLKGVVGNG